MKLRNKKTGEIVDLSVGIVKDTCYGEFIEIKPVVISKESYLYGSLAELNEEWEDYKPKEPLIKDEGIRKCVKLWAKLNEYNDALMYAEDKEWCSFYEDDEQNELLFGKSKCVNLQNQRYYTITELCGEENEED